MIKRLLAVTLFFVAFNPEAYGQHSSVQSEGWRPTSTKDIDSGNAPSRAVADAPPKPVPLATPGVCPLVPKAVNWNFRLYNPELPFRDRYTSLTQGVAAGKTASISCQISKFFPMFAPVLQMLGSSGGNNKKACEDAKKLNQTATAAAAAFGGTCTAAALKCTANAKTALAALNLGQQQALTFKNLILTDITTAAEACVAECGAAAPACAAGCGTTANSCNLQVEKDYAQVVTNIEERTETFTAKSTACSTLLGHAGGALAAGLMTALQASMAKNCAENYDKYACETAEDVSKPNCAHLCLPGGKFYGTSSCPEPDCNAPANFGSTYCRCKANPNQVICPNYTAPTTNGTSTGGLTTSGITAGTSTGQANGIGLGSATAFTNDEILGALTSGDNTGGASAGGGSGGGAGGGASSGGGGGSGPASGGYKGNGDPGAAGKGNYNAAGAGGGVGGGAGSYPFGTTANGGSGSSGGGGADLSKYMPKDGKRLPASKTSLEKQGVSDANGLSNFEKVTRQVNELRRRKETIEGR